MFQRLYWKLQRLYWMFHRLYCVKTEKKLTQPSLVELGLGLSLAKTPLIVSTTFCLQRPRAAHSLCSYQLPQPTTNTKPLYLFQETHPVENQCIILVLTKKSFALKKFPPLLPQTSNTSFIAGLEDKVFKSKIKQNTKDIVLYCIYYQYNIQHWSEGQLGVAYTHKQ
jgi:hypothetical protein